MANPNHIAGNGNIMRKAPWLVVGVAAASAIHGSGDAIANFDPIEHTTSVSAIIDVPPSITKAEYLKKTVFVRYSVATAVTAPIVDEWKLKQVIAGVTLPEIAISGTTTATYNAPLKKARENNQQVDPGKVDEIRIEGAFKDTIEQAYYPSAKRFSQLTDAEKADPSIHRVLELTVTGKDLEFTPVVSSNPFRYAQAFVTREDWGADFGNLTDSFRKAFGWDEQTFKENRQLTAQQVAYLTGVKGAIEACGPVVMKSEKLGQWTTDAIKKIVVGNYNQTRTPEEHITEDDVMVAVGQVDPAVDKAPWVQEYEDSINEAVNSTASQGAKLDVSKAHIDTATECSVAETDVEKLN